MAAKKTVQSQEYDNPPDPGDGGTTSQGDWEEPTIEAAGGESEETAAAELGAFGVTAALKEMFDTVEKHLMRRADESDGSALAAEELAGSGNIVGVGFGYSEPGAPAEPGAVSLNVYVAEPADADKVRAAMADAMGIKAASDDAAPINVIVTGPIVAQTHTFRLRPAAPGISVGHYAITAGTLGSLAVGRSAPWSNRLLVLSNNHVLANSNAGKVGDPILQPGPYDGGKDPADRIALLARWVPLLFGGAVNYVDCAYAWAWPNLVRKEFVYLRAGRLNYFTVNRNPVPATVGMPVGKTGRTTQLTSGRVVDVNFSGNVGYGGGRVGFFRDQIVIQASSGSFSAGGDSGSLIWTWTPQRNPVGLLFAGSTTHTIANKIQRVLTALDINLYT